MNPSHRFNPAGGSSFFFRLFVVGMGILLCLGATPAWGQATSSSTVTGQVTDQTGAVIPGADITLLDTATQATRSTVSNEVGRYLFVNLPTGTYHLRVSKQGFAQYEIPGLKVTVGAVLTINVTLKVGATAETVTVEASTVSELQTTTATVGSTLAGDALHFLPNLGRDVSTLYVLQPGTTLNGFVAGSYSDQNTFTLDGGNNTDDMAGNTIGYLTNFTGIGGTQTSGVPSGVIPTPVESIEEIRVGTFNQTADFNNSIGGHVQMTTKRGTNDWHGSGYGFYFGTNLGAANSWKNNHTPSGCVGSVCKLPYTPLPSNHRNRFGASLGGPLSPYRLLGGKTYFFFNYEGSRFPNSTTFERLAPTKLMRAGVIQVPDSTGKYIAYNLNPTPVTVDGITYAPATCPGGSCDPRSIGINPIVKQLWDKFMPLPNDFLFATGDGYNTAGYRSTIRAPLTTNTYIARIDHDFGDRNRFFLTYRDLRLINQTTNQVDIGGALPGNTLGQPAAMATRPQVPSYWVAGLTTNITPHVINDFRFNYTRNFWQWGSANAPPQLPGLGGALDIAPGNASTAQSTNSLIPYNVNTQSVRQRFWDGQDKLLRDDVSMIKGNHLFQFGGSYQRNFDFHMRTDNGQGVMNQIVYQIASNGINFTNSPYIPSTVPSNQQSLYRNLYSEVLGLVNLPQVAYTRSGSKLELQPLGSVATDKSIIPFYNVYFTDTWRWKPSFTLTYGLAWALEMPPFELEGKQVALTYQDGSLVKTVDYLAQRKKAALEGRTYNPLLGFATVGNVSGGGIKYPYNPFYGQFSPRVAAAWNPNYDGGLLGKLFGNRKTVIRAGYGRIYGRLNGVNLVLVPLLGVGLLQSVSCPGASKDGRCLGAGNVDPATAFRIGVDGMSAPLPGVGKTLEQPFLTGVGGNAIAQDATVLDPNYRPSRTDNFTFTVQRQLTSRMTIEVGYIGRIIRNLFQEINLDAVPYMTTLGGQTFAQAYANVYQALCGLGRTCANNPTSGIGVQPFFEAALGGAGSAYCRNFSSCTAAVVSNNTSLFRNTAVSELWGALNRASSWTLGRTMLSSSPAQATTINTTTSLGFGNYNAVFVSWRTGDWHGLTATSNFTWGRALGTGELAQYNSSNTALDVWNMRANYGRQLFDYKLVYNLAMYYQPPYFKGQRGVLGRVLGGWTFSPLFIARSGRGLAPTFSSGSCTGCQSFGEVTPPASSGSSTDNPVGAAPYTGGTSSHYGVKGSNGVGTNNPEGINFFADPASVINQFRPCILGYDTSCGGYYNLWAPPTWNLDMSVAKNMRVLKERVGVTLIFQFTNLLNLFQPALPTLSVTTPTTFGRMTSATGQTPGQDNTPRNMEFGLRIHF